MRWSLATPYSKPKGKEVNGGCGVTASMEACGASEAGSTPAMRPMIGEAKGMRDFPPAEQIGREQLIGSLKQVFESFGFRPLDTPALERFEVLSAKYAGGDDILNETFSLKDRGERVLGLRYDLTVPLARFIAQNPQLKFPFKRYQISKVWRDGPMGLGRCREFWQCDIDAVGSSSMKADAEILAIASNVFQQLGLDVEIRVSNRKLLNAILDFLNITDKNAAILIIDKLEKIDESRFIKEFQEKGFSRTTAEGILEFFRNLPQGNQEKLDYLAKILKSQEGFEELKELIKIIDAYNVKVAIKPELARGLSYYTSTIFEVFSTKGKITSSVAGGGRYDSMIGNFMGSKIEVPAVGISFGLDRIYDALVDLKKLIPKETNTKVFVIPIGTDTESIGISQKLRAAGIPTETDISGKGLSKNLNYANSLGIPFVIFAGKQELESGKLKLRDMASGKEELKTIADIIKSLK